MPIDVKDPNRQPTPIGPGSLGLIQYLRQEDTGRNCPICSAQMMFLQDGYRGIHKCLECGYSKLSTNDIAGQHKYDLPITITLSALLARKGWFEIYQPLDEQLYNVLIERKWSPEQAVDQVIRDLRMDENGKKYFLNKVDFLRGK